MNKPPFRYYLITARKKCGPRPLVDVIEQACRHGIRAIQVREKDLTGKQLYNLSKKLRKITSKWDCKLFINDRADIALSVGADGVHCRESSLSPKDVKQLDTSLTVGASIHSIESAVESEKKGADFLLFGPIFLTASKARYGKPQGVNQLKKVTENVSIPVYAVGGITPNKASLCLEAGAYGVAGISSIMEAKSIPKRIQQWKTIFQDL